MKILFAIAHCFNPGAGNRYASQKKDPQPRLNALKMNLQALHQLYGTPQFLLQISKSTIIQANQAHSHDIDVVICTTGDRHLIGELADQKHLFEHHETRAEPMMLGFEAQVVFRERAGQYDYYCYLEDDLILHDPLLFTKLEWFTKEFGNENLLQPNRYEVSSGHFHHKVYIDGELVDLATSPFQDVTEAPQLVRNIMGSNIKFVRAMNPHSGCYFLNAGQMEKWLSQPHYLDRDKRFISSLESAATLGVMKTFRIYKTTPRDAGFVEIQHFGTEFLKNVEKLYK